MNDLHHSLRRVLPAAALVALLLLLVAFPPAGQAQDATATATATATLPPATATQPSDPGNLTIIAVQPGTVVNTGDTEIVVTGTGFVDGSVVVLSNWGGLETMRSKPMSSARATASPIWSAVHSETPT